MWTSRITVVWMRYNFPTQNPQNIALPSSVITITKTVMSLYQICVFGGTIAIGLLPEILLCKLLNGFNLNMKSQWLA